MAAHAHRSIHTDMTGEERRSYVRWWIERSGLTPAQIREVATGMWSDRLLEGAPGSSGRASPEPSEVAPSEQKSV